MSWIVANWFDLPFRFAVSFCFDESCHARLRLPRPVRCCGAHVHRIFPNDTIRISMKRTDGGLAAVLYGLERERLDPGQRPPTNHAAGARKKDQRLAPAPEFRRSSAEVSPAAPEAEFEDRQRDNGTAEAGSLWIQPSCGRRFFLRFADKETGEKSAMARIATFCDQSKFPRTISSSRILSSSRTLSSSGPNS